MTNEKRLIDANALEDDLKCKPIRFLTDKYMMRELIKDAPTVDAVEVVHGEWVCKDLDNFRKVEVKCSECGWIGIENYDSYVDPSDFNYCPNCGADMRGSWNG
mgnify:CR=1 FL=1